MEKKVYRIKTSEHFDSNSFINIIAIDIEEAFKKANSEIKELKDGNSSVVSIEEVCKIDIE